MKETIATDKGSSNAMLEKNGLTRRDFLATSASVAVGMTMGITPAEAAEATDKPASVAVPGSGKRPKTMLVKNATVMVTMDGTRREIKDGGLYIEDGIIKQVGPTSSLPSTAEEVLDLKGHILLPGLVNTHHHLYQHLTRVVPAAQDGNVWNWLKVLYPMWARMTPGDVNLAIQVGLSELALSGCTTAFDHQYVFPNGCTIDDAIHTAANVGMRFHASRGSMSPTFAVSSSTEKSTSAGYAPRGSGRIQWTKIYSDSWPEAAATMSPSVSNPPIPAY